MSTAAASDPFESTANPAHYVPRPATERALEELRRAVLDGVPAALSGPAGLGKTQLLAVLGERLGNGFRVVRLPYPALSGAELCRWVLDALGEPAGEDPEGALLDRAFRAAAEGREILLLLDDASALPPGAARSLGTLTSASGGALRAVLAMGDDSRAGPTLAALGGGLREVRLEEPMSAEETARYVRGRLERASAAEAERTARFDADTLARLHGAASGIPRRVHELGSVVWRAPHGADLPARIEQWLREDEGDEPREATEAIEIDAEGAPPPVLEVEVEPEGAPEPELDALASFGAEDEPEDEEALPSPPPFAEPSPEPRRTRGAWVVLLALAGLVVALIYAMPRFESWLPSGPPRPPTVELAPAPAPLPAPEVAPAPEPEEAPPLLPDEAPAPTLAAEEGRAAPGEAPPAEEETAEPQTSGLAASEEVEAEAPAVPEPEREPELAAAPDEPATAAEPEPAPVAAAIPQAPPPPKPRPPATPQPPPIRVNVEAIPFALIHVDGGVVGETPLEVPLRPGLHVFRAEFEGGRVIVRAVEISGENRQLLFE